MAAPTPTPRTLPTGWKMPEGFRSLITFSGKPALNIWEIETKPPGIESGEPINTTTQHNINWRTFWLPFLKTLMPVTVKFAYDPDVILTDIYYLCGRNDQTLTFLFPENSTIAFFGGMQKAEFDNLKEKEFPTGTMTIVPTLTDTTSNNAEAGPVFSSAGT